MPTIPVALPEEPAEAVCRAPAPVGLVLTVLVVADLTV